MTVEELRQKPEGILATRKAIIMGVREVDYYLIKKEDEYILSFSDVGDDYYSTCVSEQDMLEYMNDKKRSDIMAFALYIDIPALSYWFRD